MKKIVVIEDDADLLELLKYNLEKEGFRVAGATTGKGAVAFCNRERPDLIILDIMLPDTDGLAICRELRAQPELQSTPVIFITARASETDRVVGLELGANDYIVKPFFLREVIARVKVQLRLPPSSSLLRVGEIELDKRSCKVRVRGKVVPVTATEFRLLECLMSQPGVVLTRQQLLTALSNDEDVSDRAVDVYVLRLRQKLEPDPGHPGTIRSVRGFGYVMEESAVDEKLV